MQQNYSQPNILPAKIVGQTFALIAMLLITGLAMLQTEQVLAEAHISYDTTQDTHQNQPSAAGYVHPDQSPLTGKDSSDEPAGSTCENPYHIDVFPLEDFEGNTDIMGDHYSSSWVEPPTAYLNGNDMVFAFTLDETTYLSGDISSSQTWFGLIILDACPDPNSPPPVLELAGSASGNEASFENLTLEAGTYFAIVSSFPPPQTIDFTLNLQAVPVAPDPEFVITPAETAFDFGEAGIGALPKTTDFVITNTGGGELKITDILVSGDEVFSLNLDAFDFGDGYQDIGLGEEYAFTLLFDPDSEGDFTGTLTVHYEETDEAESHIVSISGEGVDVLVNTFPLNEIFAEEQFPPLGWSVVNGAEGAYWQRSDILSFTGDYAAETYQGFDSNNLADEWLISPPIDGVNLQEALFSYYGISSQEPEGNNARMRILILENIYDHADDLHDNAELLEEHYFSQSWNLFTLELEDLPEQFYLAFNYLVEAVDDADFNWIFVDDITLSMPAALEVTVTDQHTGDPQEGAYVNIYDGEGQGVVTGYTDAYGETTLTLDAGETYSYVVRAGGYLHEEGDVQMADAHQHIGVMLQDRIMEPHDLSVETADMQAGEALFSWNYSELSTFRYDDGTVTGQLGSTNATWNTVMGSAFRDDSRLEAVSWYLTSEGGDHSHIKVWIIGLDAAGLPDPDNILYEADNIPNTNDQWNTYALSHPVDAANGYLVGLSYPGFLGLATDTGQDASWPFQPNTHFFVGDIQADVFTPIEMLGDFEMNLLLRTHGYQHEALDWKNKLPFADAEATHLSAGKRPEKPVMAGEPEYNTKERVFAGYRIFLDDMEQPVAENIAETSYLFESLEEGDYTAGVQAVYSSGTSDIQTLAFAIEEGVAPDFDLSLYVSPDGGGQVSGDGTYTAGEMVPVSATAADGFAFVNWTFEDDTVASDQASFDFEMPDADISLWANFDEETSIADHAAANLNIYPNPAGENLHIASDTPILRVEIINLKGSRVWQEEVQAQKQVTIRPGLRQGQYLVVVTTSEGTKTTTVHFQ